MASLNPESEQRATIWGRGQAQGLNEKVSNPSARILSTMWSVLSLWLVQPLGGMKNALGLGRGQSPNIT